MTENRTPRIKRCECGICEKTFSDKSVVEMAKAIARHWNDDHGDELAVSETPFKTEEYGGRHLHGDEYAVRRKEYYVTAYDVLNPDGEKPFKYEYVKEPEAEDVCEDCWRSIHGVDGYRELETDGWRDKYLCDECAERRKVERRQKENQSITEFATDGGRPTATTEEVANDDG